MFERLVVLNGPNDFNRVEKQLNKDRDVVICFNYSTYKLSQTLGFKSYLGNEMYRCGAFEGSSKLVNEIVNQWHLKGNNESGIKLNNIEICKIIDYRLLLILTGYFRYYHFFHGLFEKYDFKSLIVFYRKEDESNLLDPLNWYHHLTNYIRNHKPTIKQTSFESDGMRVYSPLVGPMWGELSGKSIFVKTLISFFFRPFRNKKKNRVMFFYSSFSKTLLENLIKKTKGDVDFVIPGNNISPKQMVKMGIRSHLSVFSHLRGNLSNEKRNKLEKEIQKVVRDYSESHLPKWLRKDFDQIINEIFVSKLPQINGLAESIQQELQFFQVKLVFLKDLQTELSVLVSLVAKKLNIQTALLQHGVVTMLVPSGGSWAPSKISSKIVCFGQEYRKGAGLCRYTSSEILNLPIPIKISVPVISNKVTKMNFKKILVLDMGFDLASMNFCQGLSMQLLEVVVSEIYKIEPDAKIRFRFHPGETSSHYDLCKDFINKHLPKLEVSTNPDIRLDFEWATAVIGPPSSAMIEGYQYKLPYLLVNILEQVGHFSNKFEPTFNNSVYTTDELIEKLRDPLDINIVELMKSNFDDWDKLGTPFVWDSYLNYINTTIGRRENG